MSDTRRKRCHSMKEQQTWSAARYAANARFVADLATPVVDLLAPRPGERILDLGCGDGVLTQTLAQAGCRVTGVDASDDLIAAARARGVDARLMDAQALAFEAEFDAVFSNAALHWMPRADAVIAGVWRALVPGGRFVAEMGGDGNVDNIVSALEHALTKRGADGAARNPWYFPTAEAYAERLIRAGFTVDAIALIERPTRLPGSLMGWLETFAGSFTDVLPPGERAPFLHEVADDLAPEMRGADGVLTANYVRLRFRARKPATA